MIQFIFIVKSMQTILKEIDHANLKILLDTTVQWIFFCFMMFNVIKLETSRNY